MPEITPSQFSKWATAAGLTRVWVVSRSDVDSAFAGKTTAVRPDAFHPNFRVVLLLASPGRPFWERFRRAVPQLETAGPDPLDRYSEEVVEGLADRLRKQDPTALTVYPFRHERQLLGFSHLAGGAPWTASAPFGMTIDPRFGPWFVWRGAILTALDWPPSPMPQAPACEACPAPCVAACPSGAVALSGFLWETCADFRLNAPTCRETCLARIACPVGSRYRYRPEQIRYHYGASLRMIERWAGDKPES